MNPLLNLDRCENVTPVYSSKEGQPWTLESNRLSVNPVAPPLFLHYAAFSEMLHLSVFFHLYYEDNTFFLGLK